MSEKCKKTIVPGWMISLWIQMFLTLGAASQPPPNSHPGINYYDVEEPIFHDGFTPSVPNPTETRSSGSSLMMPEPLDLSADTRFSDFGTAWELKVGDKVPPSLSDSRKSQGVRIPPNSKEKRRGVSFSNCRSEKSHEPPLNARALIGRTLERSDVATTGEELSAKLKKETEDRHLVKKNHPSTAANYWACETTFTWRDLGADHYPRHVRTAMCNSLRCANGMYQCVPQVFKLKILKRFALSDSAIFEEHTNLLPVELRADWRLIDHEIVHCCQCSSRPLPFRK